MWLLKYTVMCIKLQINTNIYQIENLDLKFFSGNIEIGNSRDNSNNNNGNLESQ